MPEELERLGRRTVLKTIGAAGVVGTAGSVVASDEEREHLRRLRRAASRYQDLDQARADGYRLSDHCVEHPELGAMGYHAGNRRLWDEQVTPEKPELLVYEKQGEDVVLVAAEFVSTAEDRPELFGQHFHESPDGFPWNWDLHVWAWKDNPRGTFAPFNPRVSCPDEE